MWFQARSRTRITHYALINSFQTPEIPFNDRLHGRRAICMTLNGSYWVWVQCGHATDQRRRLIDNKIYSVLQFSSKKQLSYESAGPILPQLTLARCTRRAIGQPLTTSRHLLLLVWINKCREVPSTLWRMESSHVFDGESLNLFCCPRHRSSFQSHFVWQLLQF